MLGYATLDTVGAYTSSGPCDNFAAATCMPNVTGEWGPACLPTARPPARPPATCRLAPRGAPNGHQ